MIVFLMLTIIIAIIYYVMKFYNSNVESDTTPQTEQNREAVNLHQIIVNQECHISKNPNILPPSYEASMNDPTI